MEIRQLLRNFSLHVINRMGSFNKNVRIYLKSSLFSPYVINERFLLKFSGEMIPLSPFIPFDAYTHEVFVRSAMIINYTNRNDVDELVLKTGGEDYARGDRRIKPAATLRTEKESRGAKKNRCEVRRKRVSIKKTCV